MSTSTAYQIKYSLIKAGYRITKNRELLIECITNKNNNDFISANCLCKMVKPKSPTISYDTIYRTLKLLEQNGFLVKKGMWDRECKYQLAYGNHTSVFKCMNCGKSETIDVEITAYKNLKIYRTELYGFCARCFKEHESLSS